MTDTNHSQLREHLSNISTDIWTRGAKGLADFGDLEDALEQLVDEAIRDARIDELNGFRDWIDEMGDEPIVYQFANRLAALRGAGEAKS